MANRLTLSQAIDGFILNLEARHLSPSTIADYTRSLKRLANFLGDVPLASITAERVRQFMVDLETPRAPAGIAARPEKSLSKKQCLNIHTGLSAFWTWCVREGYVKTHLLRLVDRPKPEKRAIVPFTRDELAALLKACERSRSYTRPGKRECDHTRATGVRDQAIILLLVDTGLRASELCDLEIRQVDLKNRRLLAFGKGDKERSLPFSASTAKALWQYAVAERKDARANEPFFVGLRGPLTRSGLLQLLNSLGERAGIADCHPHRFRHSFAVAYLKNGGDAFTLQMMLGHESMEMVRVYLRLAQADVAAAHQRASPVANWRL